MSIFQTVERSREPGIKAMAEKMAYRHAELRGAPKDDKEFSFVRMLNDMALQQFSAGSSQEATLCEAAAKSHGAEFDQQRAFVPWGALMQRDLAALTPTAGGKLVAARVGSPMGALYPYSLAARLGIESDTNNAGNLLIPKVNSPVTGQWLQTETTAITNTDASIGVVGCTPRTAGALVKFSRQLVLQGSNADEFIRKQLLEAMGKMMDEAILAGTGLLGQPTGIVNTSGIVSIVLNSTINQLNLRAAESSLIGHGVDESKIRVVTNGLQKGYLKGLYSNVGRAFWTDGKIDDVPAHATSACPAPYLIYGDFSKCKVILWGAGIEIQVDPYTSFKSGGIQARVLMHMDVQVNPEAFAVITTI